MIKDRPKGGFFLRVDFRRARNPYLSDRKKLTKKNPVERAKQLQKKNIYTIIALVNFFTIKETRVSRFF